MEESTQRIRISVRSTDSGTIYLIEDERGRLRYVRTDKVGREIGRSDWTDPVDA